MSIYECTKNCMEMRDQVTKCVFTDKRLDEMDNQGVEYCLCGNPVSRKDFKKIESEEC